MPTLGNSVPGEQQGSFAAQHDRNLPPHKTLRQFGHVRDGVHFTPSKDNL
jgi:hypothetical protein